HDPPQSDSCPADRHRGGLPHRPCDPELVMADQVQQTTTGTSGSVTPLVAGIIDDLQELIKQNLTLFKVEVREDLKKTKEAAAALGVGIGLAVVGALHLTLMLVFLLWWAFSSDIRNVSGLPL